MKKATLSIIVLFLCFGMLAVVPNVQATSYDPTGAPGFIPAPPSTPLIWNHGAKGDALLGEFYRAVTDDTIGGAPVLNYVTYVQIENTTNKWVAAHLRLRSGRYSIEVVDFPILLSPFDVFWFQFETIVDPVTGLVTGVKIWSTDTKTILYSGLNTYNNAVFDPVTGRVDINLKTTILDEFDMLASKTYTYNGNLYTYQSPLELTQGYLEVFGLWQSSVGPSTGQNFYNMNAAFWSDSAAADGRCNTKPFPSYRYGTDVVDCTTAEDVGKVLTGRVFIGDFSTGIYSGYVMNAIKDFRTNMDFFNQRGPFSWWDRQNFLGDFVAHRDWFIRGSRNGGGKEMLPGVILYSGYPSDSAYGTPDWATDFGPTWNDGDNWLGWPFANVGSFSLDEVDDALIKQTLYGSYFNGGFGATKHTFTLGAFTFPTKFLHYFFDEESGLPDTVRIDDFWPVGQRSSAVGVRADMDVAKFIRPVDVDVAMFGLEEEGVRTPSPFVGTNLPWEVNLVPFGQYSYDAMLDFCFLVLTDNSSPFVTNQTNFAGHWIMQGFRLQGQGDYRRYMLSNLLPGGYLKLNYSLSSALVEADIFNINMIPVSAVMFDYEFINYPHARNFAVSWDNPAFQDFVHLLPPWRLPFLPVAGDNVAEPFGGLEEPGAAE